MRTLFVMLLVVIAAVVTGNSTRRGAFARDASPTFRVATFNIHKGADRSNHYDLDRTIDAIAHLDADLVGVQEAMRNDAGLNCDDQPALIAAGLRQRTGRPWTHVYVQSWITRNRQCLERGRGDDVATEGVAFFSREPIIASSSVRLSEGRVGLAVRVASMPRVPVIVTHLEASRQNVPERALEIERLLPWAVRQGPGILIGDFNATPEATELGPLLAHYRDSWEEAIERGRAGGVTPLGATRPGRRGARIDYVLRMPEVDLAVDSAEVVDTVIPPALDGVSDHYPVVVTFHRNSVPSHGGTR